MFKNLFSEATMLDLPLLAMIGFIALFIGVVIWTCSRRRTEHFDAMSRLPLSDGAARRNEEERR